MASKANKRGNGVLVIMVKLHAGKWWMLMILCAGVCLFYWEVC